MKVEIEIDIEAIQEKITKQIEDELLNTFYSNEGSYKPDGRMQIERRVFDEVTKRVSQDWYNKYGNNILSKLDTGSILNTTQIMIGKDIRDQFKR